MSKFNEQILSDLQRLCRIECTPEEAKEIRSSLSRVLEYIDQLDEVDAENVKPCHFVLKGMTKTALREDEVLDLMPREQFLHNAPDQIGGMIRVPPILKES